VASMRARSTVDPNAPQGAIFRFELHAETPAGAVKS